MKKNRRLRCSRPFLTRLLPGHSIPETPLEAIPSPIVLQQLFMPKDRKLKDLIVLVPYSCRAPTAPI